MNTSPRIFSRKVLAALIAAVLLAHIALLSTAPVRSGLNQGLIQPPATRAFSTRSVELIPAHQISAVPPVATLVAAPRKNTRPAPAKAVRPEPTSQPIASATGVSPLSPAVPEAPENPSPEPTSPPQTAQVMEKPASEVDPLASAPRPPREPGASVTAYAIPGSMRLRYQVRASKFPFGLNSELLWQQNGENFEARLEFSAFGQARVQTSRGQISPQGLAPLRFSDKYRSEVAAHFDRGLGKVTFSANTPDMPLLSGAQDRLSILVQLGAMIAGDPDHFPPATTIAIQTIGPRDADTWLFTVGSPETLTLPGGEQATLKLVRNPRREFDQKVELWLAPALGYLPARVRITEHNGDYIDQQWLATIAPP